MIDLVYVVGGPTDDDRDDLRHSLRTVEANLRLDFRDVWVVGDPPAWFRGRALPLVPNPEKFRNQRQSLTAYVNHPDAAGRFILLNDDMFLIEEHAEVVTCRTSTPLSIWGKVHRDTLDREGPHNWDCWQCSILDTAEWTAERTGTDPYIYESHTPLLFDTVRLREVLAAYPVDRRFVVGEVYPIAGVGGVGESRGNAKCGRRETLAPKLANPMPYLSGNPSTWPGAVSEYIRPRFTTPSRWEAPVLNVEAITDQKQAPGLIENPLRDVLIDLASKVPADQAVVELGSYMGRSTGHLALGVSRGPGARVHAFDPWELAEEPDAEYLASTRTVALYRLSETREAFEAHMARTGAGAYVEAHQQAGVDGAVEWGGPKVGLLFHDAIHTEDAVFADLKAWLPHMARDAVVVLHDTDDVRYGVEAGAERAFTRTKTLREKWDWEGRQSHPWTKNEGKAPEARRRGFVVVRTR